jgi:hypothetical protein
MRAIETTHEGATVYLARTELAAIANALAIVRGAGPAGYGVPDWEFHTLIGVQTAEADALGREIGALLPPN